MQAIVAYLRVSTVQQGASGLGLESQRAAIDAYVRQVGGSLTMVFTEIESGKRSDRPELAKAIAHAKRSKATLLVAKLDRLSRNVAFLSKLMESKVPFICCDNPFATPLTLHILAAVAQNEAKAISDRTKAALQAYKVRGGKLGQSRNLTHEAQRKGAARSASVRSSAARNAYEDLRPMMVEMKQQGLSFKGIADALNLQGHVTRRGKAWNPVQVRRVLESRTRT